MLNFTLLASKFSNHKRHESVIKKKKDDNTGTWLKTTCCFLSLIWLDATHERSMNS